MKKLVVLLFLFATVAFSATNVFIYGNKEATNLENNIGYQKHGQKIKTGDTDDPTSVAKSGNINSLYLRNGTYGAYLKSDNGTTTNWKMLENYLTFSAPFSRIGDTVSIPVATTSTDGYLDQDDWDTFNDKPDTITELDDVTVATPAVDDILKYNGSAWVNVPYVAPISTDAIELYLDDTASELGAGYKVLSYTPVIGAEDIDTIVVNSTTSPVEYAGGMYITPLGGIGVTTIPAGVWQLEFYCGVDSATGVSSFRIDVYKRTAGGVETKLFEIPTGELNNTTVMLMSINSVQDAFTVNTTDRLGLRIYALTTSVTDRTLTFVHNGTTRASHINTPLGASHNLLAGLQGGAATEFYHLSSADHTGTGSGVLVRKTSPTFGTSIKLAGSTSGEATVVTPAAAGTPTVTLPTVNTTMPTALPVTTGQYLASTAAGVQYYEEDNSTFLIKNISIETDANGATAHALVITVKDRDGNDFSATNPLKVTLPAYTVISGEKVITKTVTRTITSNPTITIPNGATMGHASAITHNMFLYLSDDDGAGTMNLEICTTKIDGGIIHASTTISDSADLNNVCYATSGDASHQSKLIGKLRSTQSTAGVWDTKVYSFLNGIYSMSDSINVFFTDTVGTSIINNTYQRTLFATKVYDSHNAVTNDANWKFTAPRSQIYTICASNSLVDANVWSRNEQYSLYLAVDPSTVLVGIASRVMEGTVQMSQHITGCISYYLTAGTGYHIMSYQNSGSNVNEGDSTVSSWVTISGESN